MSSSGIAAGSYGRFIPSFLRNLHTVFHNGCISLHSYQQCKMVPVSLHLQCLLFVDFFDDDLSDWCGVILMVILICISLIMSFLIAQLAKNPLVVQETPV